MKKKLKYTNYKCPFFIRAWCNYNYAYAWHTITRGESNYYAKIIQNNKKKVT